MAKKETYTCDFCENRGQFSLVITDRDLKKEIKNTDLCEIHFNLIRSYIRHGCPKISNLPIEENDGK